MDADVKQAFDSIHDKIDQYMDYQQRVCDVKHAPLTKHLEEAPKTRDCVSANSTSIKGLWGLTVVILTALVALWINSF